MKKLLVIALFFIISCSQDETYPIFKVISFDEYGGIKYSVETKISASYKIGFILNEWDMVYDSQKVDEGVYEFNIYKKVNQKIKTVSICSIELD